MLAKTDTVHYSAIANAIRTKNEYNAEYLPAEMARAIERIETGDLVPFKNALITQLNEQFNLYLPMDSTTDEILAALSTVEDGREVKKFFIDLLNSHIGTMLDYDDSYEDIELTVSLAVDQMSEDARNFSSLNGLVKQTFDTYVTDVDPSEIEPKYLAYMVGINDYCQSVIDKLIDLYGGE